MKTKLSYTQQINLCTAIRDILIHDKNTNIGRFPYLCKRFKSLGRNINDIPSLVFFAEYKESATSVLSNCVAWWSDYVREDGYNKRIIALNECIEYLKTLRAKEYVTI